MIYAFDIDGTLCESQPGFYERATPIEDRIQKVRDLRRAGNKVLLFTARGMASGRDYSKLTTRQVHSWNLEVDEIIFNKPVFDLLVDDKAISADGFFGVRKENYG